MINMKMLERAECFVKYTHTMVKAQAAQKKAARYRAQETHLLHLLCVKQEELAVERYLEAKYLAEYDDWVKI